MENENCPPMRYAKLELRAALAPVKALYKNKITSGAGTHCDSVQRKKYMPHERPLKQTAET